MLKLLNFIGKLGVAKSNDGILLAILRAHQREYQPWVWSFINQVCSDRTLFKKAQQQFNINLQQLQDQTILMYRQIFQVNDGVAAYDAQPANAAQNLEELIPMPAEGAPSNDQGRFGSFNASADKREGESPSSATKPPGQAEENVRNLAGTAQNTSFSSTHAPAE